MLDPSRVRPIQQAIQFEGKACTLSTLAAAQAQDLPPPRGLRGPGPPASRGGPPPEDTELEVCREPAAQEDDRIAILETEWQNTRAALDAGAR